MVYKSGLVRCDGRRFALARSVGRESDNCRALTLTEPARRAGDIVANRGGTNHHPAPRWCRCVHRLLRREHNYNRPAFRVRQFIRVRQCVCREIDRKTVVICRADGLTIRLRAVFVGIGEAAPPLVGLCELAKRACVNVLADTGQIPRLIMTPKRTSRKPTNSRAEIIPIHATPPRRYFCPVERKRTGFCIAPLRLKRARRWASVRG